MTDEVTYVRAGDLVVGDRIGLPGLVATVSEMTHYEQDHIVRLVLREDDGRLDYAYLYPDDEVRVWPAQE